MPDRIQVMSEITYRLRCAVCEERFEPDERGVPIGDMGEAAHPSCARGEPRDGGTNHG